MKKSDEFFLSCSETSVEYNEAAAVCGLCERHWNHRVVREGDDTGELFSIRETFYNADGSIWSYTAEPASLIGESIDDLRQYLERCLKALDAPVLVDGEVEFTETEEW